jgi:hypothetical protein
MEINSQELEWKHATLSVLGMTIRTLQGFKYKTSTDSEHLHGAGDQAIGIQSGNKKCDGSMKFLKSDIDKMNDAAQAAGYDNLTDIPYQLINGVFAYKKAFGRPLRTDIVSGIKFTELEKAMEQGAKKMEIDLPFLAMRIENK